MSADDIRAHVLVSGRVQGVFYRSSTRKEAQRLGLKGWVMNLPDERVEAVFEGAKEKVEEMIAWCWKGPSAARVDEVVVEFEEALDEFSGFAVR